MQVFPRSAATAVCTAVLLLLGLASPAGIAAAAVPERRPPAPTVPDVSKLCDRLKQTPAKSPLCTHGPDTVQALGAVDEPAPAATPAGLAALCADGGVNGKRIEVLYGVPQDRVNRYDEMLATMRNVLAQVDGNLDSSDPAMSQHYRFLCENGTDVTIRNVTLVPIGDDYEFTWYDYINSLQRQVELGLGSKNYMDNDRIYMTFVDQVTGAYPYGGQGSIWADDQPDPNLNANNGAPAKYSMTAYFNANVVGHEIGHNIGAVQNSAPHTSGGYHCHDESDLMCYSDGGTYFTNGGKITNPCPAWQDDLMDCGKDDYYYPGRPPAENYLSTHWNTADSSFLTPYAVDTTAPAATHTPADGATRVGRWSPGVTATFTEAVEGVDTTTFTLRAGTTEVPATVWYDARTRLAELRPNAELAAYTTYTATLTGGTTAIRDAAGIPFGTTSWSFTTGSGDTTNPRLAWSDPWDGDTAVPQTTPVTASFSETVVGVDDQTFTLKAGGSAVPATVSYDGLQDVYTLRPATALAPSTIYTATLTGGETAIRDTSDNPLSTTSWSFTTGDGTGPTVSSVSPARGATAVSRMTKVTATFSEDVQGVDGFTFTLEADAGFGQVYATVAYDPATQVATLTPSTPLYGDTTYTARLWGGTGGIRDAAGNRLETTSWSFTTAAEDWTAPTVVRRHPASDATGASPTTKVTATFSEPVEGVSDSTFTLETGASAVSASVSYDASTRTATLSPTTTLSASTTYTATLTGGAFAIGDAAGNPLETISWSFTTASASKTLQYGTPLTFATPTGPGEQRPTSVATGDLDGDGFRDVLVSSSDNNWAGGGLVSIYRGSASGSPVHAGDVPAGSVAYGIAVGDLDGDGHLDVVTTTYGGVNILHGRGDGTLSAARLISAPGTSLRQPVIADLNGDGRNDIAAADYYHGSFFGGVSVLLANADGSFTASNVDLGQYTFPQRLAAGDLNNDGHLDLVATNGAFWVLIGNGDGTFARPVKHNWTYTNVFGQTNFAAALTDVALDDFDGDGNVDVAAAQSNDSSRTLWFFPGKGDGTFDFSRAVHRSSGDGSVMITATDVDGDGRSDVVTGSTSGPHRPAVFSTRSGTNAWPTQSYAGSGASVSEGAPYATLAAADLGQDGIAELITIDRINRQLLIRRSGNPDTDGPTISIASPLSGSKLTYQQQVAASWSCSDVSAVVECAGTLTSSAGSKTVSNGHNLGTENSGSYQLTVAAKDSVGNTSSNSVQFTIAEPGSVEAEVQGGETVSTGSVATVENPLQTSIKVPPLETGGTLTVDAQPSGTSPTGFELFGTQLLIEGPVATTEAPYEVSFTVDSSQLGGIAPSDVQVFRDGVALTGCTDPVAAVPDPCIVSRGFAPDGSGDALVTVRTSHFSTWSLGRLKYNLTGPLAPLAAAPTVNTAKAGASIPVRFKLGGDRGLDVLASGYPTSTVFTCTSTARTNEVRATSSAATSSLTYDAKSATYTYMWRTTTEMKGCRDLVLRFRDGSQLKILFNLR